ncbi:ABC transporter ATP-binding protein [Curvibacter sp. HBC28]|uniref:ABC transporter ATP-binding protein n=1 Tax=Curvibacter microcysteis TaxID=3026419 RepID=A0ABT5MBF5_9BURK|nr:ABC transporter ATP-binding protein [Curvibacter sp. HBC28]MDD0813242.1 ABC transporter ATP-binding protein [Curvibacter sp. HBC28]
MNAVLKPGVVEPPLLLDVSDLHVSYGKINAVTGVSLQVRQGQIVTVVGPNGAGKTTLMSAIMGVLPSSGRIAVSDGAGACRDEGPGIASRVCSGIGLVPETRALFSSMSIEDNLRLGAFRFRKEPKARHADALDEVFTLFPRLKERRQQEASTLSGGERQMLALGRALMGRPRLLMLDEPSLGLAPLIVREIFRILTRLREQGVSILLVEQNALAALKIADYAYVLELGQVAMEGPAEAVAADPRVVQAYLGSQAKHQAMLSS